MTKFILILYGTTKITFNLNGKRARVCFIQYERPIFDGLETHTPLYPYKELTPAWGYKHFSNLKLSLKPLIG